VNCFRCRGQAACGAIGALRRKIPIPQPIKKRNQSVRIGSFFDSLVFNQGFEQGRSVAEENSSVNCFRCRGQAACGAIGALRRKIPIPQRNKEQ